MLARKELLTFTKKDTVDLISLVPKPHLLFHPFGTVVSRVKYRTDIFNFKRECESISDLMIGSLCKWDWEECCLRRAEELLSLDKEKYYISYSGGIDSTAMMVAFLRVATPEQRKKIIVLMTHHSVEENPSFFANHIIGLKLRNYLLDTSKVLLNSDSIMVMAELGDQLFGSDLFLASKKSIDKMIRKSYQDAVPEILDLHTKVVGEGTKIFEHFHPIVDECPFPIRTAHDFFWWLNFTQKWQYVKFRFPECTNWDLKARYGSHILNFYDSVPFQQWSIQNQDLKIKDTWSSYKFTVKEFIFNFTKDPFHLSLVKIPSLEKTYMLSEKRIAVTPDYRSVDTIEELKDYVRHEF